ncbi:MAG: leucine-rich repeat domain-containing protein [Clostridia bacterium]|nr:leucine-rich repeat domain-containing protein [Clostridia bacterium]
MIHYEINPASDTTKIAEYSTKYSQTRSSDESWYTMTVTSGKVCAKIVEYRYTDLDYDGVGAAMGTINDSIHSFTATVPNMGVYVYVVRGMTAERVCGETDIPQHDLLLMTTAEPNGAFDKIARALWSITYIYNNHLYPKFGGYSEIANEVFTKGLRLLLEKYLGISPENATLLGISTKANEPCYDTLDKEALASDFEEIWSKLNAYASFIVAEGTTVLKAGVVPKKATHVILPEGLQVIGENAFANCNYLKSVTFPSTLIEIGKSAFECCVSLEEAIVLPEGLQIIGESAFEDCRALTGISLPSTLTVIGDNAFNTCYNLKGNITVPAGVKRIGKGAFLGCTFLQSVLLSEGLESIEGNAFNACHHLDQIDIPETVNSIGEGAFRGTGLVSFRLPLTIDRVEKSLFWDCRALKHVELHEGVRSIGSYAFYDCIELEAIVFPEGLEKIESHAFYHCTSLKELKIPSTVEKVDYNAFEKCFGIKRLEICDGVKIVESDAFSCCEADEVIIYNSIQAISFNAFKDSKIGRVTFKGTLEERKKLSLYAPNTTIYCTNGKFSY